MPSSSGICSPPKVQACHIKNNYSSALHCSNRDSAADCIAASSELGNSCKQHRQEPSMTMTSAVNIESIQPCFDCSTSKLAWVTADGKVRLFYIDSGSTRVKDITGQLAEGSIQGGQISHSIYSCVNWCPKVRDTSLSCHA